MWSALLQRTRSHYPLVALLLTRLVGTLGGLLTVSYVYLTGAVPPSIRTDFYVMSVCCIFIAVVATSIHAMLKTRHLRLALRGLMSGDVPSLEQGQNAVLEAVQFNLVHHRTAAWLVPLVTTCPVTMLLRLRYGLDWFSVFNVIAATLLGLSLSLLLMYFLTMSALLPVIRLLGAQGFRPPMTVPVERLQYRVILCFSVILVCAVTMIGSVSIYRLHEVRGFSGVVQSSARGLEWQLFAISGVSMLIGFVYSRMLAVSVTSRVSELVLAMNEIQRGDLGRRVDPYGNDEIEILGHRFNEMVQDLEVLHTKLEEQVALRTNQLQESLLQLQRRHSQLEKTNLELKQTQEQLVHAEKLSSLGQLVAGLAHEINNSINAVSNGVPAMQLRLKKLRNGLATSITTSGQPALPPELVASFDKLDLLAGVIAEGADRTARIVSDMKTFAHPGRDRDEEFDLHRALDLCLNLSVKQSLSPIHIEREYAEIPSLYGPYGQLHQVFLNLMSNAVHAMKGGGRLTVRTVLSEDSVALSIRDTGAGIAEDIRKKIFDPFFTTKAPGVGTGLGLSISHSIVKKLGGSIDCKSEVGQGTEFKIRIPLPVYMRKAESAALESSAAS